MSALGRLGIASVTTVRTGDDCVVAVGLAGRLRAWKRPAPRVRLLLGSHPSGGTAARLSLYSATDEAWPCVLDQSSAYELANDRKSTHPYRFLTGISPEGRFVAATIEPTSTLKVFDTSTWRCVQTLEPVEDEGDRDEWKKRGIKSVRSSLSCVELAHGHLACGSKEGVVRLWKANKAGKGNLVRRFGNLTADEGPVGAVVLTADALVAIYRQAQGHVDGAAFEGGDQSVVVWSLSSGGLRWRLRGPSPKATPPVLGALCCAEQLVVLHADTMDADADWNLVRDTAPAAATPTPEGKKRPPARATAPAADGTTAAEASGVEGGGRGDPLLLRSTSLSTVAAPKAASAWRTLSHGAVDSADGRLLCTMLVRVGVRVRVRFRFRASVRIRVGSADGSTALYDTAHVPPHTLGQADGHPGSG